MPYGWQDWSLGMIVLRLVCGCKMNLIIAHQWILNALHGLGRDRGYCAAGKLVDVLNETWLRDGEIDA